MSSATSSYALQSDDGTVLFFDDAGNSQIRQSLSSGGLHKAPTSGVSTGADDVRVTVGGSATGNTIRVTSVRPAQ